MKYFCKVTNASQSQAKVNIRNNDILFFMDLIYHWQILKVLQ